MGIESTAVEIVIPFSPQRRISFEAETVKQFQEFIKMNKDPRLFGKPRHNALSKDIIQRINLLEQDEEIKNEQQGVLSCGQREIINYFANAGASILNFVTFLNGNFHFFETLQEKLEVISNFYTKCATSIQGIIGAEDCWQKKNAVPLIGNALELPVAIFSEGYNLWLFRGISQGIGQFLGIIDRRAVVDERGEPKKVDGKIQYIKGDFRDKGWLEGIKVTCGEIPKLTKELFSKFSNIKNMSHGLYTASVGQILGAGLALCGLKSIGAFIRDAFGTLVDFSLITDKKKSTKITNEMLVNVVDEKLLDEQPLQKGLNFSSLYVWGGLTWILAAVVDVLKRIPFFEDKVNCLTNLSYTSDRGASTLYKMEDFKISRTTGAENILKNLFGLAKKV